MTIKINDMNVITHAMECYEGLLRQKNVMYSYESFQQAHLLYMKTKQTSHLYTTVHVHGIEMISSVKGCVIESIQ